MAEYDEMDFCGELCLFAEDLISKAKKPNWISVNERMPEEDKLVLMLCKNGAMFVGYCGIPWNNSERRWHIKTALNSTKLLNKGRVSHWMPLPRPPREVK